MSARIPMPVVKMAVTDVCRSEMRESQSLLRVVLAVDDKKAKGKKFTPVDTALGKTSPFVNTNTSTNNVEVSLTQSPLVLMKTRNIYEPPQN